MANRKNIQFEDTIQCRFFSINDEVDWDKLCCDLNATIAELSKDYIWNRDDFKVCKPLQAYDKHDPGFISSDPEHLISVTCVGDYMEDEWFIVYLVYELTKLHEDLIVHVEDTDGYFLLIEAADYLPNWPKPDNTDKRVFVYQSNVHIINPELASFDKIDIWDAIDIIKQKADKTKAHSKIQSAICRRIQMYPEKIQNTKHQAVVSVPIEIAAILKLKPSLLSPIVNTYCNLDMFEEKICRGVNYENCINTQVTFTKFLYAMLLRSQLKRGLQKNHYIAENDKKRSLGFKLTCGYEIIMKQVNQDIFETTEFKKFHNNLVKSGYYMNNIEGSRGFNKLLEKAKTYFLTMECPLNKHVYNEITTIKSEDSFQSTKEYLLNDKSELIEDDDSWLNITPEQLNDMLQSRYGNNSNSNDETLTSAQNITSALTDFLNKNSDYEGIEKTLEDDTKIELDPDEFTQCLEKYLNIATSNDVESSDSEYSDDEISQQIEKELSSVLGLPKSDNAVKSNLVQSIKEEGVTGPSSNILKTIGIKKTDLLDSDDDE